MIARQIMAALRAIHDSAFAENDAPVCARFDGVPYPIVGVRYEVEYNGAGDECNSTIVLVLER